MQGRERGSRLTRFEMWSRIQERTGKTINDLIAPELPEEIEYLWLQYLEIRKGAVAVGYIELDAYSRVTGCNLTPFESELMLKIDIARVKENG